MKSRTIEVKPCGHVDGAKCWTWTCGAGADCGHGHHATPDDAEAAMQNHIEAHVQASGKPRPPPAADGRGNELVDAGLAPSISMTHVAAEDCDACRLR